MDPLATSVGRYPASRSVSDASLLLGVVIVVIAVWVVIKCLGRDEGEISSPIGLALIAFGLLLPFRSRPDGRH